MAILPVLLAQPQLVPLTSLFCGPSRFSTADQGGMCGCADNSNWVIKRGKADNPFSAHNEWVCANLACAAGVPVAPYNIIEHLDGTLCFGSQFMVGEITDWQNLVIAGNIPVQDIAASINQILALDLFILNLDRHFGNYFVIKTNSFYEMFAIDHGRAWRFGAFPLNELALPACNTSNAFREMQARFPPFYDPALVIKTLNEIGTITTEQVGTIINRQPVGWLSQAEIDETLSWWDNEAVARVDGIVERVNNGSFI